MEKWTYNQLDHLVFDGIEESSTLEYKRAAALVKNNDKKKEDIVKQVAAMANAAGGTIIYGIAEFDDKEKRHLPEKLDPVDRSEISREWLDSIIQSIQPRIDGVLIHPVTDDKDANRVFYVVEVPASNTAHQARDHVYYKRRNFQLLPMEDYEVRDVMNRRSHPKIQASIFVNRRDAEHTDKGLILVKIENIGSTLAHHVMVDLRVPIRIHGFIFFEEEVTWEKTPSGKSFYHLRMRPGLASRPLFPGSSITLKRKFEKSVEFSMKDGTPVVSTDKLEVSIYADEMPCISKSIIATQATESWVTISQEGADSNL